MGRKHSKRAIPPAALLVGAFVLAGVAVALAVVLWPRRANSKPRDGGPVRTVADTFAAALFYTCDIQGRLLPIACEEPDGPLGGIARMASVHKTWAGQRADRLLVDVGNAVVVSHKQADAINQLLYKAFDTMGYAVANCGDGEAALPLDRLTALAKDRKVQMISANLLNVKDNKPIFPTHHVVQVGNVRIGFIGLVDSNIAPLKVGTGLRIGNPTEALRSALVAAQEKADLIVVLAYMPADEIYKIGRKFNGIHLILGGRCQASSAAYELVGRTLIAYLGDEGCTVGRLDDPSFPKPQPPQPTPPPSAVGRIAILDKTVPDDPSMTPILAEFQAALAGEKPPGSDWDTKMPCTSGYVGSEVCKLCHIKEYYSWQATKHAGAWGTLVTEDNRKAEKAKGKIESRYAESPACLACHATGFRMPGGFDPETHRQTARTKDDVPASKEALKGIGPVRQYQLANVGCEVCHGGGRRHLGVAIRAKFDVPKAPQLRVAAAPRTCLRCHHANRPCLEPGKSDIFELDEYLPKIKHWN